jgi:hypothetical protein
VVVLGWAFLADVRKDPEAWYRYLWLAALGGVVVLDVWYFRTYAYPAGFSF